MPSDQSKLLNAEHADHAEHAENLEATKVSHSPFSVIRVFSVPPRSAVTSLS
jgi:hypothetical protein